MINKNTVKSKLDEWRKEDDDSDYHMLPQNEGKLEAVCFESSEPQGNGLYINRVFNCTKWGNHEGFDISLHEYDQRNKQSSEKFFSFTSTEIDGLLYCLDALKYFK